MRTQTMNAMLLTDFGGLENLLYSHVPIPTPQKHEVLIKVGACSVNNMDLNLRKQWYGEDFQAIETLENPADRAASWQHEEKVELPMIQGADIVGKIIAVGTDIDSKRIGQRVIVNPYLFDDDLYIGSEVNGGFAEYAVIPSINAHLINSTLTDAELATFPCSYSTAENMLTKAQLTATDTVVIMGASGGVGSALIQLCKMRKARVIAIVSANKEAMAKDLGADFVYRRDEQLNTHLMQHQISVSLDVVGGLYFDSLIKILSVGGRYVCSGAISGALVNLDLRDLIYKDLQMYGATRLSPKVFINLVQYIEQGALQPLIAKTFPLSELKAAQQFFECKKFFGKIVIIP